MLVSNTKTEPLKDLFESLNLLNGLLLQLQDVLEKSKIDLIAEQRKKKSIYAGRSVTIRDLTIIPFNFGVWNTGSYKLEGEEYIRGLDLLLSREASWATSQAYEVFETFLLDQYAYYLLGNPQCINLEDYNELTIQLKKDCLLPDNIEYWKKFTRERRYKKGKLLSVLGILKSFTHELAKIEKSNSLGIDLAKWSEVVTEVRNAVTHSPNMIINKTKTRKWTPEKINILNKFFTGKTIDKGYQLNMKVSDAELNIGLFGSYGFLIHKLIMKTESVFD